MEQDQKGEIIMKSMFFIASVLMFSFAQAEIVEFHIKEGTGAQSWNTQDTPILGQVGDTIRIINDDIVKHQLHTFGAPCPHGDSIAPHASEDCVATEPYSATESGPLYDHGFGSKAKVWMEIQP